MHILSTKSKKKSSQVKKRPERSRWSTSINPWSWIRCPVSCSVLNLVVGNQTCQKRPQSLSDGGRTATSKFKSSRVKSEKNKKTLNYPLLQKWIYLTSIDMAYLWLSRQPHTQMQKCFYIKGRVGMYYYISYFLYIYVIFHQKSKFWSCKRFPEVKMLILNPTEIFS